MFKQKLLTVAAVLAILACGACFIPPAMDKQPTAPPPPRLPDLTGIHTLRVMVTDHSIPAHVVADSIATDVVNSINQAYAHKGITAHAGNEPADATLTIDISGESASIFRVWPSDKTESWTISSTLTAVLTRNNGAIIRQRRGVPIHYVATLHSGHPDDVWSIPEVRQEYSSHVGDAATDGIFF